MHAFVMCASQLWDGVDMQQEVADFVSGLVTPRTAAAAAAALKPYTRCQLKLEAATAAQSLQGPSVDLLKGCKIS